jgi:DNA polymerase
MDSLAQLAILTDAANRDAAGASSETDPLNNRKIETLRSAHTLPRWAAHSNSEQGKWLKWGASPAVQLPQRARDAGAKAEQVLDEPARGASHFRAAAPRTHTMIGKTKPRGTDHLEWRPAPVPPSTDLRKIRAAATRCTACPLYKNATQTVFGEGPRHAQVMFVGEQPGDQEDVQGKPFVGPAGKLLDRALEEVGIDRATVYVTNAVKHFNWEPRGKRRLHKKPSSRDIAACRPWLEAEIAIVKPKVLVCLGATATNAVAGPNVRVMRDRGKIFASPFSRQTLVTVHPSSLLRAPDEESRRASYALFVGDLKTVAKTISRLA